MPKQRFQTCAQKTADSTLMAAHAEIRAQRISRFQRYAQKTADSTLAAANASQMEGRLAVASR